MIDVKDNRYFTVTEDSNILQIKDEDQGLMDGTSLINRELHDNEQNTLRSQAHDYGLEIALRER